LNIYVARLVRMGDHLTLHITESKFAWITLLGLLTAMCAFVFGPFMFWSKHLLYSDATGDQFYQTFLFFYEMMGKLSANTFSGWSFSYGLGAPGVSVYPHHGLLDPLLLIMGMATPQSELYRVFVWFAVSRVLLSGLFCFFFIKKIGATQYASFVVSILYAFSGCLIGFLTWMPTYAPSMFVFIPLVLLAYERLIQNGEWFWLPPAVFLYGLSTMGFFNLYQLAIFLGLYSASRFLTLSRASFSGLIRHMSIVISLYAFGIGMLSFVFLPQVYNTIFVSKPHYGPYVMSYVSSWNEMVVTFFRIFGNDILGNANSYPSYGWCHNWEEAPFLYCGILAAVLTPFFCLTYFRDKQHRFLLILFGIYSLTLLLPDFRALFMGGTTYRRMHIVFIVLLVTLITGLALSELEKRRLKVDIKLPILIYALTLMLITSYATAIAINKNIIYGRLFLFALAFLFVHGLLVKYFDVRKFGLLLIVVICVEAITLSSISLRVRRTYIDTSDPLSYYNKLLDKDTLDAVKYTREIDKDFFRIAKSWSTAHHSVDNDACIQGYNGTNIYLSTINTRYSEFVVNMKIKFEGFRRFGGFGDRHLLNSLVGVKYILDKPDVVLPNHHYPDNKRLTSFPDFFKLIGSKGNVNIYLNSLSFPVATVHDSYIYGDNFQQLSTSDKDKALFLAPILSPSVRILNPPHGVNELLLSDLEDKFNNFYQNFSKWKESHFVTINHFGQDFFIGSIELSKPSLLLLTIPFDKGWSVTVNGATVDTFPLSYGFTGAYLPKGDCLISAEYKVPYLIAGSIVSLLSFLLYALLCILRKLRRGICQ